MPYDPALPANGSPNSSAEMRAQLQALNDKIDAVPAGPPGPPGPPGTVVSVTGGVVDNSDPVHPVILTDQVGGTPQLIFGGGIKPGATNYFFGADVSLSSDPGSAGAVIDGDTDNTGYQVGFAGGGTSFVFDLVTPRAISALRFRGGSNGGSNTERPLDLAFSDNGADWTSNPGPNLPLFATNEDVDIFFPNVGAHRYWRLTWTGGGSTYFGEIEGYANRTGAIPLAELAAEAARADAAIANEIARANTAYDAAGAAAAAQNASNAYTVSVIPRTWQGEWQNGPLYTAGDVVSSNGSLFVCLGDSQGQLPNDYVTPNGPWQVLAGMKGYVESVSSNNTNAVATLDTPFADPDTEALRQKMNEMLLAMRR